MVLDFIWVAAEGLAIFGLLCGAYLVLIETEPVLHFLGKKSAAPLPLSPRDLRSIGRLARHGRNGHFHFGNDVLDTQHQDLFDRTVKLRDAILSGRRMLDIDAISDSLMRG